MTVLHHLLIDTIHACVGHVKNKYCLTYYNYWVYIRL